jgi:sialate O-acetylesterase
MVVRAFYTGLGLVFAAVGLRAEVSLAPLFTDHAVLQRDKPVPVWGWAAPGERVSVAFAGRTCGAVADAAGRWVAMLDALAANPAGADLLVSGTNQVVVRDVVVGEVWLCSGQSNMEWPVSRADHAAEEIAAAKYPLVRHVKVARAVAATPAERAVIGGWEAATPQTVGAFTAVGYFFAREIHARLNGVPIGLIHSSWGGTPIESWLSPTALASDPRFAIAGERWRDTLAGFPSANAAFEAASAEWKRGEAVARAQGPAALQAWLKKHPVPRAPRGPGDPWTPSGLFNGMINPLAPYGLRGFLWYQGENNTDRPLEYAPLFATLIKTWRSHFGQADAPFFWVNLANFRSPVDPTGVGYALVREAQTRALALPHTGQAVAIDIGNPTDIHPTNKQEVGRRLALLAQNRVYGLTKDDSGPVFQAAVRQGAALRVTFTHVAGGLVAHGKPVQSLEVAGADRVYKPASARIERDALMVSSPEVREPVAVRYAWNNAPEANLFNGAGLPAVPFRSEPGW